VLILQIFEQNQESIGWMDGWMDGWMCGSKSLEQSKI
jgi:hypothetical protein